MTPEAQRIAIAEACGWRGPHHADTQKATAGWVTENKRWFLPPNKNEPCRIWHLPDYLNDLNAMHEAEAVLPPEHCITYAGLLRRALRLDVDGTPSSFWMIHATAAQRSEAFLKTIGKWTEDT